MADGQTQLVQGGKRLLDATGKLLKTCCCTSHCPYCDVLPTDWDVSFGPVNPCPGFPGIPVSDDRIPHGAYGPAACGWIKQERTTPPSFISLAVGDNGAGGGIFTVGYQESGISPGYTYFYYERNPYGTDCTVAVSGSNFFVSSDCGMAGVYGATYVVAGYGGSVVTVPVMPP